MKKFSMKLMAIGLVTAMALSAVGCSGNGSKPAQSTAAMETQEASNNETKEAAETERESETVAEEAGGGVTFPLAEPMTFDIMIQSDVDTVEAAKKIPMLAELEEKTNVKINWIALPTDTALNNLNSLFAAGQEGDAIMGMAVAIGESNISSMGSNGLLIPLDKYIDDPTIMPNLNERIFSVYPTTRYMLNAPDGHVYALAKYDFINSLESPIWINKEWLKAVGEEVPKTMDDLHRVLTKFKENDVNGNGDPNDEIPLFAASALTGQYYPEGLYGPWGLATKDLPNDRYIDIRDGKCYYVAADEAYRDAIRTLASWYKEGLLWSEIFTSNGENANVMLANEDCPLIGVAFARDIPANVKYSDQYELVPPIAADGYTPKWWDHPAQHYASGSKGHFIITRSCEHPEILAAWIDQFYSFDISVQICYGVQGGLWDYNEEGKVAVREWSGADEEDQEYYKTSLTGGLRPTDYIFAFTGSDYEERFQLSKERASWIEGYKLYKDVLGTEIWPRPYMDEDISTRINELYTDIDSTSDMYRANWITGVSDIDADWDEYLKTLNKIGLEEFVDLHQQAYDAFLKSMGQ